ncbi:MAG: penicillin-binding protein activator, partial [Deltaproteobacteria bacterium]|nr:penicillin-binding protein activator [Deltaproteobacteria bacterium]
FEKIYASKPGFIEAVFYDTATIILEILSRPDIQFRSTIRDELKKLTDFLGVTGTTSFSETGDASKSLYLIRVKGDEFVEVRYR